MLLPEGIHIGNFRAACRIWTIGASLVRELKTNVRNVEARGASMERKFMDSCAALPPAQAIVSRSGKLLDRRKSRMITIRRYESQDTKALHSIATESYIEQAKEGASVTAENPALQAYLEHIVAIQAGGKGLILVAEQDNKLVGFGCLQYEDTYAFLSDLYVTLGKRSQGVGSLLSEKLEEQARSRGADHIALRVAADNTASRAFYDRKQYQEKFVVMAKSLGD